MKNVLTFTLSLILSLAFWQSLLAQSVNFTRHTVGFFLSTSIRTHVADLDGDGDQDIITAQAVSAGNLFWWESSGGANPTFTKRQFGSNFVQSNDWTAADINGDGHLDIVSSSFTLAEAAWWKNDGNPDPSFTKEVIKNNISQAEKAIPVDIDNDGDLDVIVLGRGQGKVFVLKNDGNLNPSFTQVSLDILVGSRGIAAGDINADGLMDIAVGEQSGGRIKIFYGSNTAASGFSSTFINGPRPEQLRIADMNSDGKEDILMFYSPSSGGTKKVGYFKSSGGSNPSFTLEQISNYDNGFRIEPTDLDNNGAQDVLGGSNSDDSFRWWENGGGNSPSFANYLIDGPFSQAWTVTAGDMDNDGDLDVVASRGTILYWYENDLLSPLEINCPADVTVECGDSTNPAATGTAMGTGGCGNINITSNDVITPGSCPGEETITRTFTATNDCGNTTSCNQIITIIDTTSPMTVCPANVIIECGDSTDPMSTGMPFVIEDCGMATTTFNDIINSTSGAQVITRTFTAADACGNATSCFHLITLVDDEDPEITCPDPITVSTDPGVCGATITSLPTATATDNCSSFEGNSVLVLWDRLEDEGTCSLIASLRDAGFAVTLSDVPENEYDGTNPSPTGFGAVVHLNCITWFQEMPVSGQETLVDYVFNEGGTYVSSEWNTYDIATGSYTELEPLVLLAYSGFSYTEETYTAVSGQESHPLLTNVSNSFTSTRSGHNRGSVKTYATDPAEVLMTTDNGDAVVLRELSNGGEIISFQHAGSEGRDPADGSILLLDDIQQLYINAIDYSDRAVGNSANGSVQLFGAPDLCSLVPVGEYELTFVATDGAGNSDDCTVTLTVEDDQAPTVFCRNVTVSIQEDGTASITADQVLNFVNDNCPGATFSLSEDTFDCEDVGTIQMVTLTATDQGSNPGTCQAQVTINDNLGNCCDLEISGVATVDPVCPGDTDGTIIVNASCTTCDGLQFSIGAGFQPSNEFTGLGAGNYTVTVRDTGNPDCEETEVNVMINDGVDTEAPVFDLACQLDLTFTTEDGNVCPADAMASLSVGDEFTVFDGSTVGGIDVPNLEGCVSDNCTDEANLTIIVDDITITNEGTCSRTITITLLAEDESENVSEPFVCNYIFIDNSGPSISFNGIPDGGTRTVECNLLDDGFDPLVDLDDLDLSDECSTVDLSTLTEELTQLYDGPCSNDLLTRWQQVFTVEDGCGNASTYTLITEIVDTTPPAFESSPADVTVECVDEAPVPEMVAFDACSEVFSNFLEIRTDGDCPSNYTLTRTWLASDGCGNTSVEQQIVTVEDTTPPEIEFVDGFINQYEDGQDVFLECSELGNILQVFAGNAVATDACGGETTVDYDLEDLGNFDCLEFGYSGAYISTFRSTDACGNSATATINWFLVDETAPTFQNLPSDLCADADDLPPVADVQAVDQCEFAALTFSQSEPLDCDNGGQYIERTWTAEDACGNVAAYTQRITLGGTGGLSISVDYPAIGEVQDGDLIQLPLDCEEEISLSLEDLEAAISVGDGCGSNSGAATTEVSLMDEGDCQENGYLARYRVNVSALDACGNTAELNFMVDFVDQTAPVVTSPASLTLSCGDEIAPPTAVDACGEVASMTFVDSTPIEVSCPDNPVAYDRTWTVTDACGNTATFIQSIIVLDNDGPVFSGVPADACNDETLEVEVTALDACTGTQAMVTFDEVTSSETSCGEVLTRTWTATDACGNTSTATQQVFFDDEVAPTIEFSDDLLFGLESGDELFLNVGDGFGDPNDPLIFTADAVTVTDNCATITAEVLVETALSEDCASDGSLAQYDYKFIATDPCGNTSSLALTVFYVDGNAPDFFNLPDDITVFCDDIPEVAEVIASDDYDEDVEVVFNESQIATDEGLLIVRTFKATDDCGNTNIATQEILVADNDLDATFSFGSDVIECNSENNRLGVTAIGGTPPYSFQWQLTSPLEDGYITSDPNQRGILFTMGYITQTFTVLITDANGCEFTATVTVVCDFSEEEGDFTGGNNGQFGMNVYPNPANEQMIVKAAGLAEAPVTVALYNLFGQEMSRTEVDYWTTEGVMINTQRFPNGTYLLRLTAEGYEAQTREVVILH